MSEFQQFTNSEDDIVREASILLQKTTEEFKAGNITEDEYKELCENILDFDRVSANMTDLARKQDLYEIFHELSGIFTVLLGI